MNKVTLAEESPSSRGEETGKDIHICPGARQFNFASELRREERAVAAHNPLQIYLLEIKHYKLLSREEEIELARRVRDEKDEEAAYRLVTSNLRLVVKIAMNFRRYWAKNLLDLIQEGNLGLLRAVRKYDPNHGTKFSYYASFWIKAYMLKFMMENWKLIKIGTTQGQRKLFFNLAKEREQLMGQGIAPEPYLLAERLGVKEEEVREMSQRLGAPESSLSSTFSDELGEHYGAQLSDPGLIADEQLSATQSWQRLDKELKEFRSTLCGREADIFDRRILAENPATLIEIAQKYQISRERVRQIQVKILQNIKAWLKKEVPNFEQEYSSLL